MIFDEEQKLIVKDMALNNPGWKLVEKRWRDHVEASTKTLIHENDELLRGKIQGVQELLREITKYKTFKPNEK